MKIALAAASLGLLATVIDQLAAMIVLYVAALGAIGMFYRRYWRPAWRRYGRPWLRLADHMDKVEATQAEQTAQLEAIKQGSQQAQAEHTQQLEAIRASSQQARELAQDAKRVADAVGAKLGITLDDEGAGDR